MPGPEAVALEASGGIASTVTVKGLFGISRVANLIITYEQT